MRGLGARGYRFSIAWPRVQPTGRGRSTRRGLDFYDRLVDELLAAGIAADGDALPLGPAAGAGGRRRLAEPRHRRRVRRLRRAGGERLGDRVEHWVPVNEPNVATLLGYALRLHAPGQTLMFDALPGAHHLLLGHGRAVQRAARARATRRSASPTTTPRVAGQRRRRGRGPQPRSRRPVERAVRRPDAARPLPRRTWAAARRTVARRRHGDDPRSRSTSTASTTTTRCASRRAPTEDAEHAVRVPRPRSATR